MWIAVSFKKFQCKIFRIGGNLMNRIYGITEKQTNSCETKQFTISFLFHRSAILDFQAGIGQNAAIF